MAQSVAVAAPEIFIGGYSPGSLGYGSPPVGSEGLKPNQGADPRTPFTLTTNDDCTLDDRVESQRGRKQ